MPSSVRHSMLLLAVTGAVAVAGCGRRGTGSRLVLHLPLDGDESHAHGGRHPVEAEGLVPTVDRHGETSGAVAFDGAARLAVADVPLNRRDFSISVWLRVPKDREGNQIFIAQGRPAANEGLHLGFYDKRAFVFGYFANDLDFTNRPAFDDGEWHFWVVTQKRRAWHAERTIYLDGAVVAADEAPMAYRGEGPLVVGCSDWGETSFSGDADDLCVYDGALSPGDVERLFRPLARAAATAGPGRAR